MKAKAAATLNPWRREEVLALNALELETRSAHFIFIVAERRAREPLAPHRIGPVRKRLENQRDDPWAFVAEIDHDVTPLAAEDPRPVEELRLRFDALCRMEAGDIDGGGLDDEPLDPVDESLRAIARRTIRASSLIENVNRRIRP